MDYGIEGKVKSLNRKIMLLGLRLLFFSLAFYVSAITFASAQGIKQPNVSGVFYPNDKTELSKKIDYYLWGANPEPISGEIFALISPHAGYDFSGGVAAYGYKLIQKKPYKTVIVIGPSHNYGFRGVSVYPKGMFRTPLGDLEIDEEFTSSLLNKDSDIVFEPSAFLKEHSVEVQLPFLQKVLTDFKIVPIVMGESSFDTCEKLARLLKGAIGQRKDVLVVASSDMYHGYNFQETELVDYLTLTYLKKMDSKGLFEGLIDGSLQLCGGFPVLTTIILAKELGHKMTMVLKYTNSAEVTGNKTKGNWTVGYSSCIIDNPDKMTNNSKSIENTEQIKGDAAMLNKNQRKKLLEIARGTIEVYLKTGRKPEIKEEDKLFNEEMGAFVTLHESGELRGCIGNIIGSGPLYLTVQNMAIEAATGDPRFPQVKSEELKDIEIEISVLSPLERITSVEQIKLGEHGVIIRKGLSSGVFLPQVATETGWNKEEFLSNLCSHKAGLDPNAWKDKSTEIYIFSAEVFSENKY